jgi:hypothetical protein
MTSSTGLTNWNLGSSILSLRASFQLFAHDFRFLPLPTNQSPMPTVYCPPFTAHRFLPTVYCPPFSAHCLLRTVHCPLCAEHCLPTAYCLLPTVHYLSAVLTEFVFTECTSNFSLASSRPC